MTKCQVCGGKSELFLCRDHIAELKTILLDMPWWLERLAEAAVGQVRLSDGGRRTGRTTNRLDGDAPLDEWIDGVPTNTLKRRLLATGGVNARASDLNDRTRDTITDWMKHICAQRRTDWVTFIDPYIGPLASNDDSRMFIGPLLPGTFRRYSYPTVDDALHWLAWNVNALAAGEHAGSAFYSFRGRRRAIERVINPPLATRFLGRCPTWLGDEGVCGTELHCLEDAIEITCPACRKTHNVNRLQLLMQTDLERKKLAIGDLIKLNRVIHEDYRIPERTLRHWRQHDRLKPRGWLRPCSCGHGYTDHTNGECRLCADDACPGFDGREAPRQHTAADEPLYLWADIRRLRAERPERKANSR